jgi:hypothetical protein
MSAEINNINQTFHNECTKDPVLDAVVAGAAIHKAKQQEKLDRIRRQPQQQMATTRPQPTNEWTKFLRLFASAAASTVKTVANVAAVPALADAKEVVMASATEFVHDVKDEREKPKKREEEELENGSLMEFYHVDDDGKTISLSSSTSHHLHTPLGTPTDHNGNRHHNKK